MRGKTDMRKITLLDGAVGTTLWAMAESKGIAKVPVWKYNIEHPELVSEMTKKYVDAGSEIILTNTFGANGPAVQRSSSYSTEEIVSAAVRLGREAIADSGAKLSLAMGPLSQLMEPYGNLDEDEVEEIYDEMLSAAVKTGVDCVTIQTFMDLEMMKVAAKTAKRYGIPVYCMMTFEKVGKTMMGNSVDDIIEGLTPLGIDAIGMNCSVGPVEALPIIRSFAQKTDIPLMYKPNAGLPVTDASGKVVFDYTAAQFAEEVAPALDFVQYIGGCCGTDDGFIREIKKHI